jgi:ankyrin repeat protein
MIKKIFRILGLIVWTTIILAKCEISLTNAEITAALKAIKLEKINKVQKLIASSKDINSTDDRGFTALHHAAKKGDIQTVSALLDAGADPNAFVIKIDENKQNQSSKFTPLHLLCMQEEPIPNSAGIVEKLIKAGADINIIAYGPNKALPITPIMATLIFDNIEITKILIKNKVDMSIFYYTPFWGNVQIIHLATIHENPKFTSLLLEAGTNVNAITSLGLTPLHFIAEDSGTSIQAQTLVELGADVNYQTVKGQSPLIEACIYGNTDVANYLIKAGADVNLKTNRGFSALDYAQAYDYSETAQLLIAAGAIRNLENEIFISINNAILKNETCSALNLITKKIDLNRLDDNGHSPIILAAKCGNNLILEALLQAGANPNLYDEERKIALFEAGHEDQVEAFETLIKYGADVNLLDKNKNPLWVKTYRDGTKEMLDMLLSAGIDINRPDKHGISLLHYACFCNDINLVQKLINMHVRVNITDPYGSSPLHIASRELNVRTVRLLIEAGANVNALDTLGLPPINYAASYGHTKIVHTLIEAGATINITHDERVPCRNEELNLYYKWSTLRWRTINP